MHKCKMFSLLVHMIVYLINTLLLLPGLSSYDQMSRGIVMRAHGLNVIGDAERRWRRTRLASDLSLFKEQRRLVCQMLEKAKTTYYHNKITECGHDNRSLFRLMDCLLGHEQEKHLPSMDSAMDTAGAFSSYFDEKVHKIRVNLDEQAANSVFGRAEDSWNTNIQFWSPLKWYLRRK